MKKLLNSENERHFIAYAMGYSDGFNEGVDERRDVFKTPEEKYLYKAGYDRGVNLFLLYGMSED